MRLCGGWFGSSWDLNAAVPATWGSARSRGVKEKPNQPNTITHLSPKSIAVSAPLCCDYFCCHVGARVSRAEVKPSPGVGAEARCPPGGSGSARAADPRRAAAAWLLLALLRRERFTRCWGGGGGFSSNPVCGAACPARLPGPRAGEQTLAGSRSFPWGSADGWESFFPAKAVCSLRCCRGVAGSSAAPCAAHRPSPLRGATAARRVGCLRRERQRPRRPQASSHPALPASPRRKPLPCPLFPAFSTRSLLSPGVVFKPCSPPGSLLFLALLK